MVRAHASDEKLRGMTAEDRALGETRGKLRKVTREGDMAGLGLIRPNVFQRHRARGAHDAGQTLHRDCQGLKAPFILLRVCPGEQGWTIGQRHHRVAEGDPAWHRKSLFWFVDRHSPAWCGTTRDCRWVLPLRRGRCTGRLGTFRDGL